MTRQVFGSAPARIRGIPCLVRLDPDDWDETAQTYSRDGYRAHWLEDRMSNEDLREALRALSEQVSDAVLDRAEDLAYERRYGW